MTVGRFQLAACAIVERPDGKILMARRSANAIASGEWELIGGRLNQFEEFEDGLRREVAEECGLRDLTVFMPIAVISYMRGGQTAEHEVKVITFWCKNSGNEVVSLSEEHDASEWLDIDGAIERATKQGVKKDLRTFRTIRRHVGNLRFS